jgi:excisionase family DNA binding protein
MSEAAKTEELLSEKQAAQKLGISRITLLRMRQASRIGYYRIGTRVLFSEEAHIRPFLESVERKVGKKGRVKSEQSNSIGEETR